MEKIKHQYHVFQKSIGHYYIFFSKEGINDMETKPNVVDEAIIHPIAKNKIDTINETEKPQAPKSKKDKSIRNE